MNNIIFDAHLDLSMNAMEWNRDLRWELDDLRKSEKDIKDKPDRGKGTISFPEMRKGRIGLSVGTLIARYSSPGHPMTGWNSQEQAWAQTQGQLAWYNAMEDEGEMKQIKDIEGLETQLKLWQHAERVDLPIGYILSLEGADSILNMHYLEKAYEQGLRALGPAHYGPGVYAYGTDSSGGIGQKGKELLLEMAQLNIILDVTHLCDKSFWEALEHYKGPVWASHNNCRALVPHNRQFSDEQLKVLIERGAVIGAAFDAWMLIPNWERGKSTPESTGVSLEQVVQNIDYVCQLAGDSLHTGIGSDLDGGFGKEQCPKDLESIADLQKLSVLLKKNGYQEEDIQNILYKNWINFLKNAWK